MARRRWLAGAGLLLVGAAARPAAAGLGPWWPYADDQALRIGPRLATSAPSLRIEPLITDFLPEPSPSAARRPRSRHDLPALGVQPPRAYVRTGQQHGVDPWLLYGVALQESQIKFGRRALPYPWTLCARGRGLRYANYGQTLAALKSFVARNVTNVDCGAMQVNWHWHSERLGSFERALDPYLNLAVGARILRGHFDARGNWGKAVALYHTGTDASSETRARGARYAAQTFARLARLSVPTARWESRRG